MMRALENSIKFVNFQFSISYNEDSHTNDGLTISEFISNIAPFGFFVNATIKIERGK